MRFNLIQTSGIIAIVLSGIISFYFIQINKEKSLKNQLLAGVIIIYAIMIACSLTLSTGKNIMFFKWAHIGNQVAFLVGPLLFFYIKSLINPNFQLCFTLPYYKTKFNSYTHYMSVKSHYCREYCLYSYFGILRFFNC